MNKRQIRRVLEDKRLMPVDRFRKIFCKEQIGSGVYRKVYDFKLSKEYVVKIQPAPAFQNQMERMIWLELLYWPEVSKHFAEVLWMNAKGTILIMRKVKPIYKRKTPLELPKRIPHFFSDVHTGNYGWVRGRLVCCDYGNTLITEGWKDGKTKRAKW